MWSELPKEHRDEYKKMILAFASLTDMFAQKEDDSNELPAPIINSKYQERVFKKAFKASIEDINNTSYDATLNSISTEGSEKKYLIGIKTFGINSGDQKIAQFKAYISRWSELVNQIQNNAKKTDGTEKSKTEIDEANGALYLELAKEISKVRNDRIESSVANLKGFSVKDDDDVESVYHVLMPSKKGTNPEISVGEIEYDKIDIDNITVIGCSNSKNPANFSFTDGKHKYKYTAADSQLYMKFDNTDIVLENWEVKYAEDAYAFFTGVAEEIYNEKNTDKKVKESYCWKLTNSKGEVEKYSGFNGFYGVGSKLGRNERQKKIEKIHKKFSNSVDIIYLNALCKMLEDYLLSSSPTAKEKENKINLRNDIVKSINNNGNEELISAIKKLIYRPRNEMYIPIPNSRKFHQQHPDFFGKGIGEKFIKTKNDEKVKIDCSFNLIFEPSGDSIRSFITQDFGKAIESVEKQSILGEWILGGIFQLKEYEPLTGEKLKEIGINGIRLYKYEGESDIHLEFIWIDEDLPEDYIG